MSDDAKEMDKLMSSRLVFASKRDDCIKKIRELGALPQESFEKYKVRTACGYARPGACMDERNADLCRRQSRHPKMSLLMHVVCVCACVCCRVSI